MGGVYGGFGRLPPCPPGVLASSPTSRASATDEPSCSSSTSATIPEPGRRCPPAVSTPASRSRRPPARAARGGGARPRARSSASCPCSGDWVARSEYENHAFEVRVEGDERGRYLGARGARRRRRRRARVPLPLGGGRARARPLGRPRPDLRAARMKLLALAAAVGTLALAGSSAQPPKLAGCPVFPADNPWNQRVDRLPGRGELARDRRLDRRRHRPAPGLRLRPLGRRADRHPDHGRQGGRPQGRVSPSTTRTSPTAARTRSRPDVQDRGRRRPARADRRLLDLQALRAVRAAALGERLARGLGRDLEPALEPACGRRAGRPPTPPACRSCPGLVRWSEVAAGHIDHALRFTVERTRRAYVYPARHYASDLDRPEPAADGPARPAPRRLPDLRLPAAGPRGAPGAEDATG